MPRPREELLADLEKIRATLNGLRTGFVAMRPMIELKLGMVQAAGAVRVVETVIALQTGIVAAIGELDERVAELEKHTTQVLAGLEQIAQELAA
jgi:hypothetical protein